ncbi:DUF1007 domain-containing protein [Psychromonas sp. psych-6C06]|uniref:DUF1007 family protein n=1 Tax=Psychromonas sp. psych-6C06 TaxID=2058089 RepID=UPI000C322B75|nr:DUF1007 family protein [Psychromonas sp. psych-6C06]PKF60297.1 DUF1007 domain-containing protein [Psychromonas sp. psych-6C06]
MHFSSLIYIIRISFITLLFSISTLKAHPHSWVSVFTEIEGNDTHLTGFKMFWTFDLITTSDALSGEDVSERKLPGTLKRLSREMLVNIKANDYFTFLEWQGKTLSFADPLQEKLILEDYKLTLSFFLPLQKPLQLPITDLQLEIYEDTYYVDFLWLQKDDIQLSEQFRANCAMNIIEANTTSEQIAYAASLPKDAQGDSKLGAQFTQKLNINCL